MKKITKKWTMKNGEKIRICDMTDSHLCNTIAMLEKLAKAIYESELTACLSLSFQGEQAQYEQDRWLNNTEWEDYLPSIYEDLCEEALRRNMNALTL